MSGGAPPKISAVELQLGVNFLCEAFGLVVALGFCIAKPIFLNK